MIRHYESKMAGYAFGSNPPYALRAVTAFPSSFSRLAL
jgi:hypothetical protein